MKLLPVVGLPLLLMMGCAGASMPGKIDPQKQACKTACSDAKDEAMSKCEKEVDKDACEVAADEAEKRCVSECKDM